MAKVQQVKDLFLKATRLSDVAALFRLLDEDFALHLEDGKLEIELSESQYFECFVYDEPSQVEKRAKETIFGRFCVLGISSDGERWIFAKRGIEGRVRILKYSIAKKNVREAENPVSMQRLSALRAGNQSSFTELFERKDISRKFYQEYAKKRLQLVRRIKGMDDVDKKRLYAQVLLDRIIFLYFLQKKSLLDQDDRYLQHRLIAHGKSRESFYRKFLRPLFFDTLCVKSEYRSEEIRKLTGLKLPYLNGGLFLMHDLEDEFPDIDVDDKAFQEIFEFLEGWIWYTNERFQSDDDAIDPYILGYIFEKSLGENKSQGVYYTPPFLSEFLARETIQSHLLEFANRHAASGPYQTLAEFLSKAESHALIAFYYEKLRNISICDPACGSGQFLIQALHELTEIHAALLSRVREAGLTDLLGLIRKDYETENGFLYAVRRFIVATNLFGVDLLPEAVEITKLRLFIGMIEGVEGEVSEPLPNIDFNIRPGNSLTGFLDLPRMSRKPEEKAGQPLLDFGAVEETFHIRESKILQYYNFADPKQARSLKGDILKITDGLRKKLDNRLNQFIEDDWKILPKKKIDFVSLADDAAAKKIYESYSLTSADLNPFHWIMEFSQILMKPEKQRAGFDVLLLNPPWEIWKPNSQEFFERHIDHFRDLDKNEARKAVAELLKDNKKVKKEWLEYSLYMSSVTELFRSCQQYPDRGQGDINLYKLFLERSFCLLREEGTLGIVMPSGFYSDLGCRDLRKRFFENSNIHFLYGFENSKAIFEDVHRSFKFILFSATKHADSPAQEIPAAFMMHDESQLFATNEDLKHRGIAGTGSRLVRLSPELVQRLSPENLSVMEFKSDIDIRIVEKMAHFPPLGEDLGFHREFHVADDAHLMINVSQFDKKGALIEYGKIKEKAESFAIVYEGKNIWQYTSAFAEPTKACIIKDTAIGYKLCYRVISATTNERTFIAALIPSVNKTVNSLNVSRPSFESAPYLFNTTVFNSFLSDFFIRMITNNNIHVSTLSSLPLPRFQSELDHPYFRPLVERAARLVGTTAAYDELVHEVFGKDAGHKTHGEPDPTRRQKLKNEIDAMVARIYDLTEEELRHVLSTFPLVEEAIKEAVMEEWGRLG